MNRSTPGLPVHHQLLEFTQTHVHQVSDAIQPSHPLSKLTGKRGKLYILDDITEMQDPTLPETWNFQGHELITLSSTKIH